MEFLLDCSPLSSENTAKIVVDLVQFGDLVGYHEHSLFYKTTNFDYEVLLSLLVNEMWQFLKARLFPVLWHSDSKQAFGSYL